jgi:methionine synthase II (cobalamin-independent)
MKELVAAGAKYLQIEDLGAWMPLFTGDKAYYTWIKDVIAQCCDGVDAKIGWHFCFGNAWGNDLISGAFTRGVSDGAANSSTRGHRLEFVLRRRQPPNMPGVEFLKILAEDHVGAGRCARCPAPTPDRVAADDRGAHQEDSRAVSPGSCVLSTRLAV